MTTTPGEQLTARQRQVLIYVARGLTNRQIAASLYTSIRSIERDLTKACEVFGATNRVHAAVLAYHHRVVRYEHLHAGRERRTRPAAR